MASTKNIVQSNNNLWAQKKSVFKGLSLIDKNKITYGEDEYVFTSGT